VSTQTSSPGIELDYVKTIGIVNNGFNGRGFANPYDTVVGDDGRVFVLNRCDPARAAAIRVGICTLDDEYLGEFGKGNGTGDGQFVWAVAMALDSQELIHITDEHSHRVTTYTTSGEYLSHWGKAGAGDGELNGPAGIAIDSSGDLFVVDQHNSRVQKFTAAGKFITKFGTFGSEDGQFNLPWGAAVDCDDNVYVADWRNDRIQRFSSEGEFLGKYGSPGRGDGELYRPASVAVDSEGYVYVADWGNERVQVFDPEGRFVIKLRGEATLSDWAREFFESNTEEASARARSNLEPRLELLDDDPHEESAYVEKYFWAPASVKLASDGRLCVTERNRHRIQIYTRGE